MTKKISAIIFDFDNTLIDSWPIMIESLVNTYNAFNKTPPTINAIKQNMHKSLCSSFPEIFADKIEEATKIYYDNYHNLHSNLIPLQGAENTLRYLLTKNLPIILISNKKGDILRKEVKDFFKWDHYFDLIIGAGDFNEDKPSNIPVIEACKKLKIKANQNLWFIGDSITDLNCAKNSNCFPVLFGNENLKLMELKLHKLHFPNHDLLLSEFKKLI